VPRRRSYKITLPVVLASLVLALFGSARTSFFADDTRVEVKKVIDGDTVELDRGGPARYIGIDTPETRRKTQAGWVKTQDPFGEAAARFNEELVLGKGARLEFDIQRRDKYKRLLVYCFVKVGDKEVLAQAEILRQGLAYLYTFPPNVKYIDTLVAALKEARENRRGIWAQDLTIASEDAGRCTGQRKIVLGTIRKTRSSQKLVRLMMDGLLLVIFKNDLEAMFLKNGISPSEFYKGRKVRVFGLIKEYRGEPEIIVSHPAQIEIVD
jgi:micrococcal nuclease